MKKPELGGTIAVEYLKNYDGDTGDFRFHQDVKVRLTDEQGLFDTPELGYRAKHDAEKWLGEKARDCVHQHLSTADDIHIFFPAGKAGVLGDSFAVGTRVAGIVFCYKYKSWYDLAEHIKKEGLTKRDSYILNLCEKAYLNGKFIGFSNNMLSADVEDRMKTDTNFPLKNVFGTLENPMRLMNYWGPKYFMEKYNFKRIDYLRLNVGFNDELLLGIK